MTWRRVSGPPANLREKPERQLLLDSDFLPVELQVLGGVRQSQHAHELPLSPAVVASSSENLSQREGGRHVLGKSIANELKAVNRLGIVLPASKDLRF